MLSIEDFRHLNHISQIALTQHSRRRLVERGISIADVVCAINNGKIIEQYPDDFPFPSCLILGKTMDSRTIHLVASIDEGIIYLITAYYPSPEKWDAAGNVRRGDPK